MLSPVAAAQPPPGELKRARAIARQGFAAYDRKEYAAAIALFAQAYEIAPDPGLLYNMAQSYRQIGPSACDEALTHYRRFLQAKDWSGDRVARENVEARIAEMEACVERRKQAPGDSGSVESGAAPPEGEPGTLAVKGAASPEPGNGRRTVGWVVAGAGTAALALAVVGGVKAIGLRSDLEDGCTGGICPPDLQDEVDSYDRWRYTAFVAGGVGVAAVAVGVWMLVTADKKAARPAEPMSSRGGPTAQVDGRTVGLLWSF